MSIVLDLFNWINWICTFLNCFYRTLCTIFIISIFVKAAKLMFYVGRAMIVYQY